MPLMLGRPGDAMDELDQRHGTTMSIPPSGNTRCDAELSAGDALSSIHKKSTYGRRAGSASIWTNDRSLTNLIRLSNIYPIQGAGYSAASFEDGRSTSLDRQEALQLGSRAPLAGSFDASERCPC